jgi:hypothetical protein
MRPHWSRRAFHIGAWFVLRTRWHADDEPEWNDSHVEVFGANVSNRFHLGSEHHYYDGPHCSFSLGWLHFAWFNDTCKKCWGET